MKRTNLVLMISAALTLAACGGNSSNDSAPSDPTPPKTAQPTPKPAPTPETSEQEAEKPEAKKPATGGSSGGSGGSYAGGGSYGGGGSSGGSSGSTGGDTGGDTGGGDTGDTGDTGGGDETGDTGGGDETGDTGGGEEKEQPAKDLTGDQVRELAANSNSYFELDPTKSSDDEKFPVKAVDAANFAEDWSSFTVKEDDEEKTTVLIPNKAAKNELTDGSSVEVIETKGFSDWGGLQTASSRVTKEAVKTGTNYISKVYSYSRFGSITKGTVADDEDATFTATGTTYYSVGSVDPLSPKDANKPPVNGTAKYEGIAFIDTATINMIGDFIGNADFGEKSFTGEISGLKTYKDNSPKDMEAAETDVTETIYNNDLKTRLEFAAEIKGHNLKNAEDADIKVNGSFYGPEAAEVGGVISKEGAFSGAFGGEKKDAAPAE